MKVTPGTIGGYEWTIHFLKNPGSNDGYTFPPGSGLVHPPAIDHTLLSGMDATVSMGMPLSQGSAPLAGSINIVINGEGTEPIPYNIDSTAMAHAINDLQSVGDVSVESGIQTNHPISGITASVAIDCHIAALTGRDLREYLAPGDAFRIGGSPDEIDGAEKVGSATLSPSSPILSNVQLDSRNHLNIDETVRIGGEAYTIAKNGVEVQMIAVHRSSTIPNGDFYQLKVAVEGTEETIVCLTFDASASEVETALNDLSILVNKGGVFVTKSDTSSGFIGDAHFYKVYFSGDQLIGDVDEMVVEQCVTGVRPGVDATTSHVHIRTLIEGGATEHHQIVLASDSGSTGDSPAFQLTISDLNANSWSSPCYGWGAQALDLASIIDVDLFSGYTLSDDSVTDLGGNTYKIGTASFVEGVLLVGDYVNPGNRCAGRVVTIDDDGKSVVVESLACTTMAGDDLYAGNDIAILDSFTNNGGSVSELTRVTLFSDADIIDSGDGLYKIHVEFEGVSLNTSCLS